MKFPPKLVIYAVYKNSEGNWRAFCAPYDVTCEAKNSSIAMKRLESMVKLYEEGLVKYSYPQELSVRALSNNEDQEVFSIILRKVSGEIEKKVREDYLDFQVETKKEDFRIFNPQSHGYYFQPCL